MLESQLYDPQQLVKIEQNNKYNNRPELYLKREVIVQERQFVKQIIYMLQGLETELFVQVCDELQFDSQKGDVQRVYQFALREDQRTVFTHLTYETLKGCSEIGIKIGNYLKYLSQKSRIMYEKSSNLMMKSFSEGIIKYLGRMSQQFSELLRRVQIESGNLSHKSRMNNEGDMGKNVSLLRVGQILESKSLFISELVNIVSKTLPYLDCQFDKSPTQNYLVIQVLFDQFSRLMDSIELQQHQKQQLQLIYENSLTFYCTLIKNWIQMNPYLLQSQKTHPFFIKLSQLNFSLSKGSLNYRNLIKLRRTPYDSLQIKQLLFKTEEFIQLFFRISNLLVQEYIPQLFKKQGLCILQLGKIIQFIYLYFSTEEKPHLNQYFSVEKQFQPLFELINTNKKRETIFKSKRRESMFMNKRSEVMPMNKRRESMFMKVSKKRMSVSERMGERQRKGVREIKIREENPYEMYASTRGIFIDTQERVHQQVKQLREGERIESIGELGMEEQEKGMYEQKRGMQEQEKIRQEQEKIRDGLGQSFVYRFERVLSQIIQNLYQKALYFFQQQSQRQFFKLQSHLNLPQSLVLNSKTSLLSKQNIPLDNQLPLCNQLPLLLITNHERIISSISLTLIAIKKFMLYEQGDFFLQLISNVNTLFETSTNKISKNLLTSHIEEAIKSSSANDLPQQIKQKISFMFLKKTINPEIKQLKVWSVFSILYRPQFPVNCIFNNQIMNSFGQIFNFILNIKQCQHSLKMIWDDFKQNAKITTQYSLFQIKKHPFQSKILAVRNNIHHFINLIFGSIMITIEELWETYVQQINLSFTGSQSQQLTDMKNTRKIHNPISLIKLTQEMLRNMKKQITENLTLANTMILITELIGKFKKLLKTQPDSKEWSDVIFGQQISYIGHEFMGIMQMAKNIEGIGDSIFYNIQF